jgi:hypothetical protein
VKVSAGIRLLIITAVFVTPVALFDGVVAAAPSLMPAAGTWQITSVPDDGSDMINGTLRITTSGDVVGAQGTMVGQAPRAFGTGTVVVDGAQKIKYSVSTYYYVGQSGLPGAQDGRTGLTGPSGVAVKLTHAHKVFKGLLSIQFDTPTYAASSGIEAFGSVRFGSCALLVSISPPS